MPRKSKGIRVLMKKGKGILIKSRTKYSPVHIITIAEWSI
jgi:hypothetical protein